MTMTIILTTLLGLALIGGAGFAIGRLGPGRSDGGRADSLSPVARQLMLGRLVSGMTHELNQSLNVIMMAHGNVGYILEGLSLPDDTRQQLSMRIQRVSTHCETASKIMAHYKWFGQEGLADKGPLTVGTALDRAIEAVRYDFRRSAIPITASGDALDLPAPARHGAIEIIAAALLLAMRQVLIETDHATPPPIIVDATMDGAMLTLGFGCEAPGDRTPSGSDAAMVRLARDMLHDRDGALRTPAEGASWYIATLPAAAL